ncbi:MAG: Bug family tripartite tricarboxylate transporter substrate binding protein [Beijerinckiaceae bacterium]
MNKKRAVALTLLGAVSVFAAATAQADPVSDFYAGREVSLTVGSAPGGGYDAATRLLSRHYSNHIPGKPTIIVRNMPGAGSLNMMNFVANAAPKDGTVIGAPQNTAPLERLLHILSKGGKNANFDAEKLNWIGTSSQDVYLLIAWHTAPVNSVADLTNAELVVGSSGNNTDHSITARLLNQTFGTKLKIVTGYPSAQEIMLAMERGELQGNSGRAYSSLMSGFSHLVRDKKVKLLIQMGIAPHPDLKEVPFALDLVKSDDERKVLELTFSKFQMSRPLFMAAEVPKDRVQALRRSFDAMMKDPQFLADAEKSKIDIDPLSGEDVQRLVEKLFRTPQPLVEKARALLQPPGE